MKALTIILQLIDQILTAIKFRKDQNDREKLEADPAAFFTDHFGKLPSKDGETNKTDLSNNA